KQFVAAIKSIVNRLASPLPDSIPDLPDVPGAAVSYQRVDDAHYALVVSPTATFLAAGLAACVGLHVGTEEQARKIGLYVIDPALAAGGIVFSPEGGFYVVSRSVDPSKETYRVYHLPARLPADAFALVNSDRCKDDIRGIAVELLQDARLAMVTQNHASRFWTVEKNENDGHVWFSLRPYVAGHVAAVLHCARVASTSLAELATRGFTGRALPSLNYAPELGLYVLR
ncbi:MAG: hypothetical protein JO103_09500, partial [Candidatus Eremiobacteraeota bacterium]|nr:hypothetical protein [Candidatus Eremiobacteraeota bacterium]